MTTKAVYLGMQLASNGTWKGHRRMRARKARRWKWRVQGAARKRGALPIKEGLRIGGAGERAALCYGAELWAETKGLAREQLQKAQARQ